MFNDGTTIPENAMTNSMYQSCIQACWTCAQACEMCASACLREEDVKAMARCIELDRDCADFRL